MADRADFERIALGHFDALYRLAVTLCGQTDAAEDLVQTALARGLDRFDTYHEGTNCRAWLSRIMRNAWLDELRHRKVAGPQLELEEEPPASSDEPTPGESMADAGDLLEQFADAEIIAALGELAEEQRTALVLVDVAELSHEEAAEVMEVAVGTIKSRTARARKALRKQLREHARDLGYPERKS